MRERDRNDEDLTELQTLTIETGELVQRLDELNVAEETEASRVAMERIGRRNGEITARLAVVEKRIARRNRVLTAHEERIARRY